MAKPKIYILVNKFYIDTNLTNIFKYNEHSETVIFARQPDWNKRKCENTSIRDVDLQQLILYLSKIHDMDISDKLLIDACVNVALQNQYNPVKNFVTSEIWDGIKRLPEWLIKSTGCDDNIYTRLVAEKIMIATVKRIYEPGSKFDHMLILEGDQGIGKSTLVEIMAGEFYLDTTLENKDKDLIDSIRSAVWVEFSEMAGMDKHDVDWLRSFLSRKVDRVRLSYNRLTENFPRKSVFIGTINPSGNNMYLRDDTGNRRYWPIECRRIDLAYARTNRSQLWAEAYKKYLDGAKYWIDEEDVEAIRILRGLHADREIESPTTRRIRKFLIGKNETCMDDLIGVGLGINMSAKSPSELLGIQITIGKIMRREKWRKGNNENRDKYYAPDYDPLVTSVAPTGSAPGMWAE